MNENEENKGNYGSRRVYIRLTQPDFNYQGSHSTVYRVMKENNLLLKKKRRPNSLTRENKEEQKSENLINQNFTADKPNKKWLTDITEIPTAEGKLYICPIFDCFDGQIIGLTMDDNMRKELCVQAFKQACTNQDSNGVIIHSDRGSQFTSFDFRNKIAEHGAIQSMSGTGRCYDNSRMESFFATLKKEKLYKINTKKLPMKTVKSIVFRWIFTYYNRQRVCTFNEFGYPPCTKREMYKNVIRAA